MKLCWLIDIPIVGGDQDVLVHLKNLGHQVVEITAKLENPNLIVEPDSIYPFLGSFQELNFLSKLKIPVATYGLNSNIIRSSYISYMPQEWFLNHDAMMTTWGLLKSNPDWWFNFFNTASLFVRPDSGKKTFTGQVFDKVNIKTEMEFLSRHSNVMPETILWVCPAKKIEKEFRFWISAGKVVTYSEYSWDRDIDIAGSPSDTAFKLAEKVAGYQWQADRIYTVDIQDSSKEAKIIELNSFSCAGLYRCDGKHLLETVSRDILSEWED